SHRSRLPALRRGASAVALPRRPMGLDQTDRCPDRRRADLAYVDRTTALAASGAHAESARTGIGASVQPAAIRQPVRAPGSSLRSVPPPRVWHLLWHRRHAPVCVVLCAPAPARPRSPPAGATGRVGAARAISGLRRIQRSFSAVCPASGNRPVSLPRPVLFR